MIIPTSPGHWVTWLDRGRRATPEPAIPRISQVLGHGPALTTRLEDRCAGLDGARSYAPTDLPGLSVRNDRWWALALAACGPFVAQAEISWYSTEEPSWIRSSFTGVGISGRYVASSCVWILSALLLRQS